LDQFAELSKTAACKGAERLSFFQALTAALVPIATVTLG